MLPPTDDSGRAFRRSLAAILIVDAVVLLPLLGSLPLWNIDEGRLAEISREMVETGDWIVPRIGGEPYFSYPPLSNWLMAGSGLLFGFNAWAMRLPSALAGIALIAAVACLVRRLGGDRAGLASALVLATTALFVREQTMCRADILVTLFVTLAIDRFVAAAGEGNRGSANLLLFYSATALGVLAKGPIALALVGLGIVAWLAVHRQWRPVLHLKPWLGVPCLILFVAPWYLALWWREGTEFIRVNLLLENINAFALGHEHPRPLLWYFGIAPQRMAPWILVLPSAWLVRRASGLGFALAWLGAVLLLLTVSASKRHNYLVYLTPAFAAFAGITLSALWQEAPGRFRAALVAFSVLLAAGAVGLTAAPVDWWSGVGAIIARLPALAAGTVAAAAVIAGTAIKGGAASGTSALALYVILLYATHVGFLAPQVDVEGRDGVAFCRRVAAALPQDATLYAPPDRLTEGAVQFHVRRIVPPRPVTSGYILGTDLDRDALVSAGRRVDVLDSVRDDRGRLRLFLLVHP